MVKITSIFGSYRFLRIAWHDIFLLSDLSDHFPASWNLYTMYPAVILRSRRENAHLLVNPIPKLTMVLIWKTPPCLKFGKTSNRDVKNLPQTKLSFFKGKALGTRLPFNQNSDRSDREKRTTSKGGPVFRNFSGWTEPIHWVLDRNFRKFWLNGSRPMSLSSEQCTFS